MSDYLTESNLLRIVELENVVTESSLVKSFFFKDKLCAQGKPGQFVMIWIPRVDEIPMSISSQSHKVLVSVTVANVGEATRLLHKRHEGDIFGVRGPFGNGFKLAEGNTLLIGGGTGIAPLAFLAGKLAKLKSRMTFLLGARTKTELLFLSRIKKLLVRTDSEILASTEDGSYGYRGVVTSLAKKVISRESFDMVYTCGKETMVSRIFKLTEAYKAPLQASLERLMKCAIGLCGSCAVWKYRVCVDGPVFTSRQLREIGEHLGGFKRGYDGRKISISE